MNLSERPNPEHRSNNALLCFCLGAGLASLAYLLGVGAVFSTLFGGGDPAALVGGIVAAIALGLLVASAFVLMAVGGVWMLVRVIADQRGEPSEKRYRDVNR